jgi:hypothetical protein
MTDIQKKMRREKITSERKRKCTEQAGHVIFTVKSRKKGCPSLHSYKELGTIET